MPSLSTTTLSAETIAIIRASLAALDKLKSDMMAEALASVPLQEDEGVGSLYRLVCNVRDKFSSPSDSDAERQMSPEVVQILSEQIAPALADVVTDLTELWDSVQHVVESGSAGQPVFEAFLADAENETSSLNRVQDGLSELDAASTKKLVAALPGAFAEMFS